MRTAALTGEGDDLVLSIAVAVAGSDENAALEAVVVGEYVHQFPTIGTVDDVKVRCTAGACICDNISDIITVDVACGHTDFAVGVGLEAESERAGFGVIDSDGPVLAGRGAGDEHGLEGLELLCGRERNVRQEDAVFERLDDCGGGAERAAARTGTCRASKSLSQAG